MKAADEGTLLQRARRVPISRGAGYEVDPEILEAAVAWLKGDVSGSQIAAVWKVKPNMVNAKFLSELKNAARAGKLRIEVLP